RSAGLGRVQAGDVPGAGRAGAEGGSEPRGREVTMGSHAIKVTVNGEAHQNEVESRTLLVHFLRDQLRLTGTHIGCDTTHCGACTVLLDGAPVKSCTVLAVQPPCPDLSTLQRLQQD